MKEMDIVILSYAKNKICFELTSNTIISLFESEKDIKFNVFVVESEQAISWEEYSAGNMFVKTLRPELPYGYHKFLNFGRKAGNAEFVALCNNDLLFRKGWASKIFEAAEYNPHYYSFSPLCPKTQPKYGFNVNGGLVKGYSIRTHISGWCIVQRREIYDLIGDLDETFTHWYCDNDYGLTLMVNGVNHMLVSNSIVEHHDQVLGKTTTEVIEDRDKLLEMTQGAQRLFENKWGGRSKF